MNLISSRIPPIARGGRRALCSALLAGLALAPSAAPSVAMAAPRTPLCVVSVGTPVLDVDDLVQAWEPNDGSGAGTATFSVKLSNLSATGPVTVHYATEFDPSSDQNHTPATPGSDFVSTSGDLTFQCDEPLTKYISVTILDDGNDGGRSHFIEQYKLRLTQPVNATLGNGVAIGQIVDTDQLPPRDDCQLTFDCPIITL